jgi:hypothetical protein
VTAPIFGAVPIAGVRTDPAEIAKRAIGRMTRSRITRAVILSRNGQVFASRPAASLARNATADELIGTYTRDTSPEDIAADIEHWRGV